MIFGRMIEMIPFVFATSEILWKSEILLYIKQVKKA